jgi:hypothetical protein
MSYGIDESGVMYVIYKNGSHPVKPVKSCVTRYIYCFAGILWERHLHHYLMYRIEPSLLGSLIYVDPDNPNSTIMTTIIQAHTRIPTSLLDLFIVKSTTELHSGINKYYHS